MGNFAGDEKGINDVCKYNYCVMIKSVFSVQLKKKKESVLHMKE